MSISLNESMVKHRILNTFFMEIKNYFNEHETRSIRLCRKQIKFLICINFRIKTL